jgi:hypothetical protein
MSHMDTDFTEIGSRLRSLGTAIGKCQTIVDAFCGKEVDDKNKNVAKSAGDDHRHDAFQYCQPDAVGQGVLLCFELTPSVIRRNGR